MFITRVACSEKLDWSVEVGSPGVAQGFHGKRNRSAGTYLCLRGLYAAQVDVSCLAAPELYPAWLQDPLLVSASTTPFQGYEMCCTLLSADQVCATQLTRIEHRIVYSTCWEHVTHAKCAELCWASQTSCGKGYEDASRQRVRPSVSEVWHRQRISTRCCTPCTGCGGGIRNDVRR